MLLSLYVDINVQSPLSYRLEYSLGVSHFGVKAVSLSEWQPSGYVEHRGDGEEPYMREGV